MLSGSTVVAVAGDSDRDEREGQRPRSNPTVAQRVEQLREERNAHEREVYEQRKLAGLCTRCGVPALEDGQLCAAHRDYERNRTQATITAMRKARRAAGCCIRCGRKSKRAECVACLVRAGRLPRSAIPRSNPTVTQSRVDVVVEADGYERRRFVGQGRKGAPSKATLDRMDFKDVAKAVAKFVEQVNGGYKLVDEGKLLPGDADAIAVAALDQLALASRFIDDILDRHRYGEAVKAAGKLRAQGAKVKTADVLRAKRR
jgi:hypothetical protein